MTAVASSALAGFLGMALLSLAMERHYEQVWGTAASLRARRLGLRLAGSLLLLLAALQAIAREGASIGLSLWIMEIGLAAVLIGLLLSYAPRRLPAVMLLALAALLAGLALPAAFP